MRIAPQIRSLLQAGDRRTVRNVAEVVHAVLKKPELVSDLVQCVFNVDVGLRMRAADALEKVSRKRVEELQPYASVLLGLFEESEQQELRWHLAVILPRLQLNASERRRTSEALRQCMAAKSSIVKTFALQGFFDLTVQEPSLVPTVLDLLMSAERNGTPAMRARSRKLLLLLERRAQRPERVFH